MHSGDEREALSFWYEHCLMALEVLMHELSIHQEELGSISDEAPCTRLQEVGRCKGVEQDCLNTIKVVIHMLSYLGTKYIGWVFFLSKLILKVG